MAKKNIPVQSAGGDENRPVTMPFSSDREAVPGSSAEKKQVKTDFEAQLKARLESEIGSETTADRAAQLEQQVSEVTSNKPVKNPRVRPNRSETPAQKPEPLPTPAEEARKAKAGRLPRGVGGTKNFTFDVATREEAAGTLTPRRQRRLAKRLERGMGLPGSQVDAEYGSSVNEHALQLMHRDHEEAQRTGKAVNGVQPGSPKPNMEDVFEGGYHQRLAQVIRGYGTSEDAISHSGLSAGGTTTQSKVNYLHSVLTNHFKSNSQKVINHEAEGFTHWVHPRTGKAIPIAENHPDMPKITDNAGNVKPHFVVNQGKSDYVVQDPNSSSNAWSLDTTPSEGWDPSKPEGWNSFTFKGGVRALKLNTPNDGKKRRSLFQHHGIELRSSFAPAITSGRAATHGASERIRKTFIPPQNSNLSDEGRDYGKKGEDPLLWVRVEGKRGKQKKRLSAVGTEPGVKMVGRKSQSGKTGTLTEVTSGGEASPVKRTATSKARILNEGSLASPYTSETEAKALKMIKGTGQFVSGSTNVQETTEIPVEKFTPSLAPKEVNRPKTTKNKEGREVTVPLQRGLVTDKRDPALAKALVNARKGGSRQMNWADLQPAPRPAEGGVQLDLFDGSEHKVKAAKPEKPAAPVREPDAQMAFPGMEDIGSAHAAGIQWKKAAALSETTRTLQRKAKNVNSPVVQTGETTSEPSLLDRLAVGKNKRQTAERNLD